MIDTQDFMNYLNDWLGKSDSIKAKLISGKRGDIPVKYRTYNKTVYCSMIIDLNILSQKNFLIKNPTNWYKTEKEARNSEPFRQAKKDTKAGEVRIMVAKKFNPSSLVLDIDAFVNITEEEKLVDLGMDKSLIKSAKKSQPVLIDSGVMINTSDYSIIKS